MSIPTSNQIAARLGALEAKLGELDELRAQVEALLTGRSAGMRAAFETYGKLLDELRDRVAVLEAPKPPRKRAAATKKR